MERYGSYKDSGVEWIREVPTGWEFLRSWFMFTQRTSKNHPEEPLLSVTQERSLVRRDELETNVWNPDSDVSGYKLVKDGDFVISLRSFEGGLELSEVQGIVSPAYTVFYPIRRISSRYFKYLFKCHEFIIELNKYVSGIRQGKNISYSDFSEISLPIPSLTCQDEIGQYLDRKTTLIDSLIEKTVRKIELLKEKRTSLINEVVTKGLNPDVEMKDSGVEWIGEIPSHWGFSKVGRHFQIGRGRVISKEEIDSNSGDFPVYSSQTTNDGELGKISTYDFEGEYVTWTTDGANTGTCFHREGRFNTTNVCGMLKSVNENYRMKFLSFYLNQVTKPYVRVDINPKLMNNMMSEIPLLIPPISEQVNIENFLRKGTSLIDSTITIEEKRIELLKEYRQSLISEMVTGKVKVTRDE